MVTRDTSDLLHVVNAKNLNKSCFKLHEKSQKSRNQWLASTTGKIHLQIKKKKETAEKA